MDLHCLLWPILLVTIDVCQSVLIDLRRYRGAIVHLHNRYRSMERAASDMKELQYDFYLERRAAEWSEQCHWGHQEKGLGENLAMFWSTGQQMSIAEIIVQSHQNWWNEIHSWSWDTSCGNACHYTQMIWGKTERVGCSLSKCPNLSGSNDGRGTQNADYFVCFYDPPGNYIGQYPYTRGQSCSRCRPEDVCRNRLCSNRKTNKNKYSNNRSLRNQFSNNRGTRNGYSSRIHVRNQFPSIRGTSNRFSYNRHFRNQFLNNGRPQNGYPNNRRSRNQYSTNQGTRNGNSAYGSLRNGFPTNMNFKYLPSSRNTIAVYPRQNQVYGGAIEGADAGGHDRYPSETYPRQEEQTSVESHPKAGESASEGNTENTMAEQKDPEIPDVPEHDLSEEDMVFVSLLYNYILALEAEESVKERERARGSLPSVTKSNKTCQSLVKASQFVLKRESPS